jgi:hypothetical protein
MHNPFRISNRPARAVLGSGAALVALLLSGAPGGAAGIAPAGAGARPVLAAGVVATAAADRLRTRSLAVCFGPMPAGWAGTQRASFPTADFGLGAVAPAGDRAYGMYRTAAGRSIAMLDLRTGALTPLADLPADSAGFSSMAADSRWLAWVQADSVSVPRAWTLHALDLQTGEQLTLATSELPDGTLLFGQNPLLALRRGVLTWAQPTSTTGLLPTAEVRAYDLAARRQSVLDSGHVSSPVFAGPYLVWGRIGDDGGSTFRAVNAITRTPVELPEQVRSQPGIVYLAGSPSHLAWSTDFQHVVAWDLEDGALTTYTIADTRNPLQFLTLAGHFLIWYTGFPSAALDLDTGGAFDASIIGGLLAGQIAGSEATIVRTDPLSLPEKGGIAGTAVSSLRTAAAPAIPGCQA